MIKLETHERNNLLKVVEVFGLKDKLTMSQSDCLCHVLDIIRRDIKSAASRPDEILLKKEDFDISERSDNDNS
jgi:hypothetical protein